MIAVLRHALAILALPVVMLVVVPRWLLRAYAASDTRWPTAGTWPMAAHAAGVLVIAAGFALFVWCLTLFIRVGRGTLAPWDPTKALVAAGPYRFVRNPMITGVITMLVGQALYLGSRVILGWAITFFVINNVYFVLLEEPGLERRFGDDYLRYKREVPRWLPRLR
jgi:protein-S-isoprenylcysteine O-methyltransferase Ste14